MPEPIIGWLSKPTSAAPVSIDVDLGTTPKVIMFFMSGNQGAATSSTADLRAMGFGFAVHRSSGVEEASISASATDGSASGARYNSNGKAISGTTIGSLLFEADCTFLFANHGGETVNGFRLTFTTNDTGGGTDYDISYVALCGDDITDAQITTLDVTTSGPNTYNVALDFWPDACFFFSDGQNTLNNRSDTGPVISLGMWSSNNVTTPISSGIAFDDTGADYVGVAYTVSSVITGIETGDATGNINMAAVPALDSTPGITLTEAVATTTANKLYIVAIQGGKWAAIRDAAPAGVGSDSITGVGFKPRAAIATVTTASSNATSGDKLWSIGASNVGTHRSASGTVETRVGVGGDDTAKRQTTTRLGSLITSVPTIVAEVDVTSFDDDGLTVSWSTGAGTSRQVHYMLIGDGPVWFADSGDGEAA